VEADQPPDPDLLLPALRLALHHPPGERERVCVCVLSECVCVCVSVCVRERATPSTPPSSLSRTLKPKLHLLMQGRVRSLANVYTLSFLCVMALFAFGNMMLKYKRGRIRFNHSTEMFASSSGYDLGRFDELIRPSVVAGGRCARRGPPTSQPSAPSSSPLLATSSWRRGTSSTSSSTSR